MRQRRPIPVPHSTTILFPRASPAVLTARKATACAFSPASGTAAAEIISSHPGFRTPTSPTRAATYETRSSGPPWTAPPVLLLVSHGLAPSSPEDLARISLLL